MKKLLGVFLCVMLLGFVAAPAMAYPTLQLDIIGGSYDTITQDTVGGPSGTLVALLNPDADDTVSGTYYISAAIVPMAGTSPGSIDNFAPVSGTTAAFSQTGAGAFGHPAYLNEPHGIFDTWYWEYSFEFDPLSQVGAYNVQDDAGDPPAGSDFYAAYFDYDMSSLIGSGYNVHFDLYSANEKAPFSHDATAAPEPATLLLLGTGLIGVAGIGRKKIFK